MSTFALIPARGGSKGIPRKNILRIAGKPLIAWTIEAARAAPGIAAVVVSTEDEEIAAVSRAAGAEVPFMRPATLATDEAPGIDPVLHAIDQLPHHESVLLLQATSPLRNSADIEGLLALATSSGAPAIVSVRQPHDHPQWMYRMDGQKVLSPLADAPPADRRQDLPPIYALNGAMYFARTGWLRQQRTFVGPGTLGYVMPAERSVDIDTMLDWKIAELLLGERS